MPDLPHDAALFGLALFFTIGLAGVLWIETRIARKYARERHAVDTTPTPISEDERRFWTDIEAGPCRLTEAELNRKATRLAALRAHGCSTAEGRQQAREDILRKVGRAVDLFEFPYWGSLKGTAAAEVRLLHDLDTHPPSSRESIEQRVTMLCELRGIDRMMQPEHYQQARQDVFARLD
jgi:hypothetical protein